MEYDDDYFLGDGSVNMIECKGQLVDYDRFWEKKVKKDTDMQNYQFFTLISTLMD